MSGRVRVLLAVSMLVALCGLCVTGVLAAFGGSDEATQTSSAVTVVYGELDGPSDDAGPTDAADQEDGESTTDADDFPGTATSRSDHPRSPERVHALRPDRPPRLADRG